jgi:hypothetical protein
VAHVLQQDRVADDIEHQRDFMVAQLVSIAAEVGLSLTRADAQLFLDLADHDVDQALGLALTSDFTSVPCSSAPDHDFHVCGPAPAPLPSGNVVVGRLDEDVAADCFLVAPEPKRSEPVISETVSSKLDGLCIGPEPYHNLQMTLMNPGNAGQITGQLSTQVPLSELVFAVCRILGVPYTDAQILQDGKELRHDLTLISGGAHLPLKLTGTVHMKMCFSQQFELHPCKGIVEKTDSWEDTFHINGARARMCGSCGSGPYINEACSDLAAHHSGGANSCKACGWYSKTWEDWPLWDGGRKRSARPKL